MMMMMMMMMMMIYGSAKTTHRELKTAATLASDFAKR